MTKPNIHNNEVINQFSLQAESYNRLTGSMNSDRSAALRDMASVSPDDLLLDVCCGPGLLTMDLAPHVHSATGALRPNMSPRTIGWRKYATRRIFTHLPLMSC
jgi:ubiquinone/menaquinone biosynthesis C-methylase UbiE